MNVETKTCSVLLGTVLLSLPLLYWQSGWTAQLTAVAPRDWLILGLLGISLCATGYAVQFGVSNLLSNHAMLLFLFELVAAAVSSYFLAGEAMQLRDWLGASLIVSASLLSGKLHSASAT